MLHNHKYTQIEIQFNMNHKYTQIVIQLNKTEMIIIGIVKKP